jgi:hypothetical protein
MAGSPVHRADYAGYEQIVGQLSYDGNHRMGSPGANGLELLYVFNDYAHAVPPDDPLGGYGEVSMVGIQAEWWLPPERTRISSRLRMTAYTSGGKLVKLKRKIWVIG